MHPKSEMAFDHILLQGAYVFQCSELLEPYPVIEHTRNVVVNASDVDEDYVQCEHDQTRGAFLMLTCRQRSGEDDNKGENEVHYLQ